MMLPLRIRNSTRILAINCIDYLAERISEVDGWTDTTQQEARNG